MNIREMTVEDYDAVYALWLSCAGMGLNNVDDSREGIAKFLRRNPTTCLVSEEDGGEGEILGVLLAGHDGRRAYIYHTAVSLAARHRGIATLLLEKATEALRAEGIAKAALVVFARNAAGNAFWETQGFAERTDLVYRNKALKELERIDT